MKRSHYSSHHGVSSIANQLEGAGLRQFILGEWNRLCIHPVGRLRRMRRRRQHKHVRVHRAVTPRRRNCSDFYAPVIIISRHYHVKIK